MMSRRISYYLISLLVSLVAAGFITLCIYAIVVTSNRETEPYHPMNKSLHRIANSLEEKGIE